MKNLIFLSFLLFSVFLKGQDVSSYVFEVKELTLSDNQTIAYVDEGSGAETLVFVHGLGSYLRAWEKNIHELSGSYRCIALDLPGYGQSGASSEGYHPKYFATVLAQLIEKLALKNVILVGHSMGGQIAMHLALDYPELIKKMVLVAPAGLEAFSEAEKMWFKQIYTPAFVAAATPEQVQQNYLLNFFKMPKDAETMIKDRIAQMSTEGFAAYCEMIPQCVMGMLEQPVLERLSELKLPVFLLFGKEDRLIPNKFLHPGLTTEAVAAIGMEKIPNARLHMVSEAGHFVQWEKSAEVNQAISDFVKN